MAYSEEGVRVVIPGQPEAADSDPRQRNAATAVAGRSTGYKGNQPLATRYLDPNFNPELAGANEEALELLKIKVREQYAFVMGEPPFRKSHPGPVVMWVTAEELKGQEHKVEIIGRRGASVQQAAAARPVTKAEELTFENRSLRIQQLRAELDILVKDEEQDLARQAAVKDERVKSNAEDLPPINPNIVNLGAAPVGRVTLPAGMQIHNEAGGQEPMVPRGPRPSGDEGEPIPTATTAAHPAELDPPVPGSLDEELADDLESQVASAPAAPGNGVDAAPVNPNVAAKEENPDQVGEEAGVPIIQPVRRRPKKQKQK